jgi:hypothetical protein
VAFAFGRSLTINEAGSSFTQIGDKIMSDYIPSSDAEFRTWLQNFLAYANANLAALGLVAADLAPLQTGFTTWETAYADHTSAQAAGLAARQAKDDIRRDVTTLARGLGQRLQSAPTVLDSQRQSLGLNVRSTTRTTSGEPTSRPVATVDTSQRLQHTISFVDELSPTSKAKPTGVSGCEVWVKIGTAPADPSELSYLATDTRTPYTAVFDGSDGGKMANYMLRWVNTRGERGPWSQTVSATITA